MAITHNRPRRKVSGGRYIAYRKKKAYETGRQPAMTKLDDRDVKAVKAMGGHKKQVIMAENVANLYDPKTKKYQKAKIKTILENPANRHFSRRNIITKGAIIDTELGKAKVTSRPGQEGTLNAVLI